MLDPAKADEQVWERPRNFVRVPRRSLLRCSLLTAAVTISQVDMSKQRDRFRELDEIPEERVLVLAPKYVQSKGPHATPLPLTCALHAVPPNRYDVGEARTNVCLVDMSKARPRSPLVPQPDDDDMPPMILVGDTVGDHGSGYGATAATRWFPRRHSHMFVCAAVCVRVCVCVVSYRDIPEARHEKLTRRRRGTGVNMMKGVGRYDNEPSPSGEGDTLVLAPTERVPRTKLPRRRRRDGDGGDEGESKGGGVAERRRARRKARRSREMARARRSTSGARRESKTSRDTDSGAGAGAGAGAGGGGGSSGAAARRSRRGTDDNGAAPAPRPRRRRRSGGGSRGGGASKSRGGEPATTSKARRRRSANDGGARKPPRHGAPKPRAQEP